MSDADDLDLLKLYTHDLRQSETVPLSRAETVELVARANAGDSAARDRLIRSFLRLALQLALCTRGLDRSDAISAANLAVMEAVDSAIHGFDPEQGNLSTYITKAVRGALRRAVDAAQTTASVSNDRWVQRRALQRAVQVLGARASEAELAAEAKLPIRSLRAAGAILVPDRSWDDPVTAKDEPDPLLLIDVVPDRSVEDPEVILTRQDGRVVLTRLCRSVLSEKQWMVVGLTSGLIAPGPLTYPEIDTRLQTAPGTAKAVFQNASRKLKRLPGLKILLKALAVHPRVSRGSLPINVDPRPQPERGSLTNNKLTNDHVRAIKRLLREGRTKAYLIAKRFHVAPSTISAIRHQTRHRSVKEDV